jgi:hypothetical protein
MEFEFPQRREFPQGRRQAELSPTARSGYSASRSRDAGRPRHSGLFEAVHRLDARLDETARQELSEWIREEYRGEFGDIPLGLVSTCRLGPPYVDHRLDLFASIIDHFSAAESMPEPFQQARVLARVGAYEFVEVYASGRLVPVRPDGTPVPVEE